MGRSPCRDSDAGVIKKGPWTEEEDEKLKEYIEKHGYGSWRSLPKRAGLNRCGKSCRLRWTNYLRPNIKRGRFSEEEEQLIVILHSKLGNKWSTIAGQLPGRTDNEIKNYWNTHLRKKLLTMGIDPVTHRARTDLNPLVSMPINVMASANYLGNLATNNPLIMNAIQLQRLQLLQILIQAIGLQNRIPTANTSGSSDLSHQPSDFAAAVSLNNTSFMMSKPSSSVPSLAAYSPENCINVDEACNPAVSVQTTRSCEAYDLQSDFEWKDILDAVSWSEEML